MHSCFCLITFCLCASFLLAMSICYLSFHPCSSGPNPQRRTFKRTKRASEDYYDDIESTDKKSSAVPARSSTSTQTKSEFEIDKWAYCTSGSKYCCNTTFTAHFPLPECASTFTSVAPMILHINSDISDRLFRSTNSIYPAFYDVCGSVPLWTAL